MYFSPKVGWVGGAGGFCLFDEVLPVSGVVLRKAVLNVPPEGVDIPLECLVVVSVVLETGPVANDESLGSNGWPEVMMCCVV